MGTAVSEADESEEAVTESRPGQRREIGHDEFDPVGTLTLIGLYLAILVVMWIVMYFVEFLGNGPTVVGMA
jgi:hypothetical protein